MRRAVPGLVVGLALAAQLSCGGDSDAPCPADECTVAGSTIVKWRFNHYPEWMFESDACSDLGVVTVHMEIVNKDDPGLFDVRDRGCGEAQTTFVDVAPGMYSVSLTPLDVDGNSLVKAPITGEVLAGSPGANTELVLDVPYTAWSRAYTGQLLFRIAFNGMACPADVVNQVLELTIGGQPVDAMTDKGQKLDGMDRASCRPLTEEFAQFVQGLPFGPAKIKVQGTAQNNMVLYEQEFDTFIGAGIANPTFTYDIVPPPDAGVDAMGDAAMVDAP